MPVLNTEAIRLIAGFFLGVIVAWLILGQSGKPNGKKPPQPIVENLIDFVSYAGLLLGVVFWGMYYWDHIHPELTHGIASYGSWAFVLLMGIVHPLAVPVFFAWTWPKDPVNVYLQEKIQETTAYKMQVYATLIVGAVSLFMVFRWIGSAMGISDPIDLIPTTIMFVAFSVLLPSFGMLRIIPKHWRALADMADEVERRRRLLIVEQVAIEAQLAQSVVLLTMPVIQNALDQRQKNAKEAAELVGAALIRVNEAARTIVSLLAQLTRNKNLQLTTAPDEEIYDNLERAFLLEQDVAQLNIIQEPRQIETRQPQSSVKKYSHGNK